MTKPYPNLTLLPIDDAVKFLVPLIKKMLPSKRRLANEKISDAKLCALEVLRIIHKQAHRSCWFRFLKMNVSHNLPSYTQIYTRLERLGSLIQAYQQKAMETELVIIDSMPLPVCRSKRSHTAKIKDAALGFSTQGKVYGFKLHAWVSKKGRMMQYHILPANMHDMKGSKLLDIKWAAFGCPKVIGDMGYVSGTVITPPKKNVKRKDLRWREGFRKLRMVVERTFSWLVGTGIRNSQVKTLSALTTRIAFAVMAHNIRFDYP